eukprot:TRINITY_DN29784_c0_g1_i1.p1 TRINITY_DN29784_c0_g1~~TRINITY_DN29784_c0_g1_i1.p1  ORF type:complete len:175 (+),score=21.92 TRINITY_DN29784_c0_g1_i1:52-576(+)
MESLFVTKVREWVRELDGLPSFRSTGSVLTRCSKKDSAMRTEMIVNNLTRSIVTKGQKFFLELTETCESYGALQKRLWTEETAAKQQDKSSLLERINASWAAKIDEAGNSGSRKVQFLQPGTHVIAKNVRLSPSLNDLRGTVVEIDSCLNRAKIDFGTAKGIVSLRTTNLEVAC